MHGEWLSAVPISPANPRCNGGFDVPGGHQSFRDHLRHPSQRRRALARPYVVVTWVLNPLHGERSRRLRRPRVRPHVCARS